MATCLKAAVLLGLMVQLCYPLQPDYVDCGSGATIETLAITPCESDPCILHKERTYTLSVTFTPVESSNNVTTMVYGRVGSTSIPLPIPLDSCKRGHLTCPIEKGETVTYTNTEKIGLYYPLISFTGKWEIYDDKWKKILCFEIPLDIKN